MFLFLMIVVAGIYPAAFAQLSAKPIYVIVHGAWVVIPVHYVAKEFM